MAIPVCIGALFLMLAGCARQAPVNASAVQERSRFGTSHFSADFSLLLRLCGGHPRFRYELIERDTDKVLARAESAIDINDFSSGGFRGRQDVLFSPDNRTVCIVEDVGESAPAKRYIVLRRTPSGGYSVRYLTPPMEPDPSIVEFEGDFPFVIAVTADTITLSRKNGLPRPQPIDSVPGHRTPRTAQF